MTVEEVAARLRAAGCVFAEDEAGELLVAAAAGVGSLADLVARRVAGAPLEQVVGSVVFDGLRLRVAPGVFVPRRRTELLVATVAGLAPPGGVVVDVCAGVAAIAAAVAARRPDLEVHATELDAAAVAVARHNLRPDRVHRGDLLDALPVGLRGRVDVVVANAPYVPTEAIATMPVEARDHEPRLALDGGADGLAVHRRLAGTVGDWLAVPGHVVVEASRGGAAATASLLAAVDGTTEVVHDDDRDGTAVVARFGPD